MSQGANPVTKEHVAMAVDELRHRLHVEETEAKGLAR